MILGIDLGGTNIRIGQTEGGKIVKKIAEPSRSDLAVEPSLEYFKQVIGRMITPEVEGIGIGVPSVVDIERGVVYNVANIPSWKEVHLRDVLTAEFGVPVYINNDANCFVLGEKEYGSGRDFRDIVGVALGTGVGAGIVVNGALYGGRNTGAGEIGSLPYLDANFERYCSSEFFIYRHGTTGKEAGLSAGRGDAAALKIWDEFGVHVGRLVEAILYTYDPELIVFGGGIAKAFPLFERTMRGVMGGFPYPATVRNIRIEVSGNPDIAILGAAALVKNKISTY